MVTLTDAEREELRVLSGCCIDCPHTNLPGHNSAPAGVIVAAVERIVHAHLADELEALVPGLWGDWRREEVRTRIAELRRQSVSEGAEHE